MERAVEATADLRASVSEVADLLHTGPGRFLSDHDRLDDLPAGTIRTTVTAPVGGGTTVTQDVTIELDGAIGDEGSVSAPLRWTADAHERVLPSFSGTLAVSDVPAAGSGTRLTIGGTYEVPLGPVGTFGDALVGHRVARRTLGDLARVLAHRLDAEADRRRGSVSYRPPAYNADLRDYRHEGHRAR